MTLKAHKGKVMVEVGGVEPPSRKASGEASTAIADDFCGRPLFGEPGGPSANAPALRRLEVPTGQPLPQASSLPCPERPPRTLGRSGVAYPLGNSEFKIVGA